MPNPVITKYTVDYIAQLEPTGDVTIPNEPKYQGLISFLKQFGDGSLYRDMFGTQIKSRTYFQAVNGDNDNIVCEINGIINRLTESNKAALFLEFTKVPFSKATDIKTICLAVHSGFINCSKYFNVHADMINFLLKQHEDYARIYKDILFGYNTISLDSLDLSNDEQILITKNKIATNYELILSLLVKKILVNVCDINRFIDNLMNPDIQVTGTEHLHLEICIRFLLSMKKNKIPIMANVMAQLKLKIESGSCPSRIKFLMMNLGDVPPSPMTPSRLLHGVPV